MQQTNKYFFIYKNNSQFLKMINEIFTSRNSKIEKIEDLTIEETKILFNNLMNFKFNKTIEGVSNYNTEYSFIQIFDSVANVCDIDDNKTVGEVLFNEKFKEKMDNYFFLRAEGYTKIESKLELAKALGLKPEDFGKLGFKVGNFSVPGRFTALVIDTSKSWEEFIKEEPKPYNDIALIDSSHAISEYINGNVSDVESLSPDLQKLLSNIPIVNKDYQKNGTCWANANSACSVILNNCKTFDDIVENGKLKSGLESKTIEESNKYYLSNVNKIQNEKDYVVAGETKDGTLVKINVEKKYLFQRYDRLIKNLEKLKNCEKSLEQIKDKYKKEYGIDLVFEKNKKQHISYKPFDGLIKNFKYEAVIGQKQGVKLTLEGIKGFKYNNFDEKLNATLYDINLVFTFPDKNIEDIDEKFLKDLEYKIKQNGINPKALGCSDIKTAIGEIGEDNSNDYEIYNKDTTNKKISQMFIEELKNKEKNLEQQEQPIQKPESIVEKFEEKQAINPEKPVEQKGFMTTLNFGNNTNKINEQDKKENLIENMQQGGIQATGKTEEHNPNNLKNVESSGMSMCKGGGK